MSALSDSISALRDSATAEITRVQTAVVNYRQQIADLQAQVDAGTATPEDMSLLAQIKADLDALDPTNSATLKAKKG